MDLTKMKIKDYLLVSLKGILLGLVSVGIPGVSASTIGIIVGIYFIMVEAIANVFKDFKHNFTFLLFLIIGYAIGSVGAAFSVTILFEKFPLVTTFAILGFICSSIPDMFWKLRKDFKKPSCWISFAIILFLIFIYNITLSKGEIEAFPRNPDVFYLIRMGVIGVVTSATFIIPGVDFAVVFFSLGIYYPFMNMITEILSFGAENYLSTFIGNIEILGVYLIGYFVGVFLFSKLIRFVSAKYGSQTQFASFAFIVAAPFIVVKSCVIDNKAFHTSPGQIAAVIMVCLLSFIILFGAKFLGKNRQQSVQYLLNNENNPGK